MGFSLFEDFGSDEQRAVEGIAALLDLYPREDGEDDEGLAWRMANWALLQGPSVRWDAMLHASRVMINAKQSGAHFSQLSEMGSDALYEYNRVYGGGWD